jgi:DNA-binding IclR family transcriptional regulator
MVSMTPARERDMGDRPTLIQSVQRALRIIEVIGEHDGRARAKEVARAAGLPLATTYHLLRTCTHEGWLQRLDDGSYVLGHRIDVVRTQGTAARGIAHARPALEWLRDALCGAVYLARYVDGEIVVAEIVDSARAPRIDLWVGMHDAAHATALGKCILGQLPETEREDYLARHPLHDLTPRTVVDRRRLHLPAIGGIAVDDGEYAIGVSCLGATVASGHEAAAVGVVTAPREMGRALTRQTLLLGAGRVSRALTLGPAAI